MKRRSSALGFLMIGLLGFSHTALAAPVSKIVALWPEYNSDVVGIEWTTPLGGGCGTSIYAYTNPNSANQDELTAFLLTAFASDLDVEVHFGGGCQDGKNWIQTIKLVR